MKEVSSLKSSRKTGKREKVRGKYSKAPLFAGLLSVICFIFMCFLSRVYPFGDFTILVSDLEAQYAPFLFFYKNHLLSQDFSHILSTLTYSFGLGAGKNIMGTFGYYLASPLNLLVLFFDASQVNEFVLLLMMIRISLAASFMTLFIRRRAENKDSWWPILFGIMYAYSSYTTIFLFQIMWLDGYMLLPLLLYFIEDYLDEGKIKGLIVTLLLLFLTNYYIAYMAGIFSFFYLIFRMIMTGRFSSFKSGMKTVGRFIAVAAACGLSLAVILIPVGLDTIRNADPTSHAGASSDYISFSAVDLMDQLFNGTPGEFSEVLIGNLPFVFISTIVNLFFVIFMVSRAVDKREKIAYGICAGLIYLSLNIDFLDTAWQVFDEPNWFWHRQTFVFMPVFLVIALKLWEKFGQVTAAEIAKGGGILLAALFVAQSLGEMKKRDQAFLFNLCFIVGLVVILILMKKEKWHEQLKDMPVILPGLLCLLTIFEVVIMAPILSSGISTMSLHYGFADKYNASILAAEDCAEASAVVNNSFRSEMEQDGTGNTSAIDDSGAYYAGYNGISIFNSNSNKVFNRFLKQFGYHVNYNYFTASHTFASPDLDAFFSIGTVYTWRDYSAARFVSEDFYDAGLKFYINDNVLPPVFPVDRSAFDFDMYSLEKEITGKNYFSFRNNWYDSLFPGCFDAPFLKTVPADDVELTLVNCALYDMNTYTGTTEDEEDDAFSGIGGSSSKFDPDALGLEEPSRYKFTSNTVYRMNKSIPLVLDYEIDNTSGDELYINITAPRCLGECTVTVNGKRLCGLSPRTYYSTVIRAGSFAPGQKIHVSVSSDSDSFTYLSVNFAYFDKAAFDEGFQRIDISGVTTEQIENGYVKITSDLEDNRMILTTIPCEEGWTLYIDGNKAEITPYADALIGIDPGTGHHDIELVFTAPGLKAGACVSLLGILMLAATACLTGRKNKATKS
ncbi:MAG TPA: hypothetical protein DCW41_02435 [Clostridiales bacterium]|nr:hypothetical protein [Clostridiales bacterium]